MRERGVEVVEMHHLLTEAVKNPEARTWIGERKIRPNTTGVGLAGEVRSWLDNLEPRRLAEFLIGGVVVEDVPDSEHGNAQGQETSIWAHILRRLLRSRLGLAAMNFG
jgi:arginine deiminase